MSLTASAAHRLGFETRTGRVVWLCPFAVTVGLTALTAGLIRAGILGDGYFSPYVAATAVIAAKICVRAGLLAAVLSIAAWDFFIVPPVLIWTAPSASELTAWLAALAAGILVAPRISGKKLPTPLANPNPPGALPFVRRKDERSGACHGQTSASCWDVQSTGDWVSDDSYGRELARLWVDQRQSAHVSTPPLAFVLSDMIEGGKFSGVEAGFASAVERAIAAGAAVPLVLTMSAPDHHADNLRLQG